MLACTLCPKATPTESGIAIDGVFHAICDACARKRERVRQTEIAERRQAEKAS